MDLPSDEQINRWLPDDQPKVKDFNNSRVGKALKVMLLNELEKPIRDDQTNPTEEDQTSRSALDTDRVMLAGKTLLSE